MKLCRDMLLYLVSCVLGPVSQYPSLQGLRWMDGGWGSGAGAQTPLPSCAVPSLAAVSRRRIFQVQADKDANACVNEGVVASL